MCIGRSNLSLLVYWTDCLHMCCFPLPSLGIHGPGCIPFETSRFCSKNILWFCARWELPMWRNPFTSIHLSGVLCFWQVLVLTSLLWAPWFSEQTASLFWPVFVTATLAAMIASQAMISATFSCVKQSMALGCFPRMKIVHTSKRRMGQIYIPVINWFLMIMCIFVVAIFRRTTDIANAYGYVPSSPFFFLPYGTTFSLHFYWRWLLYYDL